LRGHRVISFVSGKGGAGKSVILANLAALLVKTGASVLMVDCDFFTRGLTFYMIGDKPARTGILDYLREDETLEHLVHRLEERTKGYDHLSLLPASSRTTLYSVSDLDGKVHARDSESLKKIHFDLRGLFLQLAKRFDYVLVDTRSGVDPVSLLPALASDEYILVVEEDKTSWRIGDLLIAEIRKISDKLVNSKLMPSSSFKGFIINKVTEEIPKEFVRDYLEKRVIEGKCLLQVPLERAVPMAFKVDKLVIDESPSSTFSQKIEILSHIVRGIPVLEKPKKEFMAMTWEFLGTNETLIMIIAFLAYLTGLLMISFEANVVIYVPMLLFSLAVLLISLVLRTSRILKRMQKRKRR
jgi:MinD-like ATPase involved in chromosome partitioning or flagellar assembly